jgi:hypothetical protein
MWKATHLKLSYPHHKMFSNFLKQPLLRTLYTGGCAKVAIWGREETVADRYCTNCGHELEPGDRFCTSCGRPTSQTEAPAAPPPQQTRRSGKWGAGRVLFFVLVVPVLIAIALFVFLFAWGFLSGLAGG